MGTAKKATLEGAWEIITELAKLSKRLTVKSKQPTQSN